MDTDDSIPKVSGGEATITYSGTVTKAPSEFKAKLIAKRHIQHVFDVKHGDIGFIDIVISTHTPYQEGRVDLKGIYPFKAEFTLDEGPASVVFEERSEYLIDCKSYD